MADFDYYVNEKRYLGTFSIDNTEEITEQIGERYYVKFYPPEPTNCFILLKKKIFDSLIIAPFNGWKKIPIDYEDE